MPDPRDARYTPTAVLRSSLTCGQCGVRKDCTLQSLLRYNRRGWPRCCGEVMALVADEPLDELDAPELLRQQIDGRREV